MVKLIPVQYNNKVYPKSITPALTEVAGHFDCKHLTPSMAYSLHTEYAAKARSFKSHALYDLDAIRESHHNGIPLLWKSERWAHQFAKFVFQLCADHPAPSVIEIHPPFDEDCHDLEAFCMIYLVFEETIINSYPDTQIVIENRFGTRNARNKFILSKTASFLTLSDLIDRHNLKLRLCLDIPQLFTAHVGPAPRTKEQIDKILQPLAECRHHINSIHVWGKKRNRKGGMQAHFGTLNTWLESIELKEHFLKRVFELLDDDKSRYFVPEVNSSNEDFLCILEDFTPYINQNE